MNVPKMFLKILMLLKTLTECKDKWDNTGQHTESFFWRKAVYEIERTLNIFCYRLWHKHTMCHKTNPVGFSYFILNFYCIFPLPFILLMPSSPQLPPHCYPCPWLIFPFCLISAPPNLSPHSCLPALHLWVCLYFIVSLVCSLDSTYEWNQMVFVFLWLAYFT